MSAWKIIMPTAASNMVLNPSAEAASKFSTFNGGVVSRITTQARFGDYSYSVCSSSAIGGMFVDTQALANAIHWATFYEHGTVTGSLRITTDGTNYVTCASIGGASGGWVRYGASVTAAQCNGSLATRIVSTADEVFTVDAVQVEQSTYYTTYIDGNRGESPIYGENTGNLYYWNGHRHASTSWRDAQERGGGRIMDLLDNFGLSVQQVPGAGMPPLRHNLQDLALQPGAAFQSTKVLPRDLTLRGELHHGSIANLHSLRKDLIDLMKPDAVRGAQPFTLGYSGAHTARTVYCRFRYADGLGIGQVDGGVNFLENRIPIRLEAVSPFWIEDNRETATLGFVDTLTSVNRVMARIAGRWQKLGTGFNADCFCSAYDPTTGRVYFGGDFTTGNGVTVNRITYWNPTTATFVAMDAGVGGTVSTIAIAPNGDVWIGGTFLTVGSGAATSVGLAMWDLSAGAWVVPTATATSFGSVNALVIDGSGNLYIGGSFTQYGGAGVNSAYIVKYTAAGAFAALGTGMSGTVYALAVWIDGTTIYVGGDFLTGNSVTINNSGYWNGTTFVTLTGGLNNIALAIAVAPNGNVYYGGLFSISNTPTVTLARIGMWNGTNWQALGTGVTGTSVRGLHLGADGLLYVVGSYTTIGPFITVWPVTWNGSSWQQLDISSTGAAPAFYTFLSTPNGDLYEGDDTSSTRIVGSATSNITTTNTVSVFPNFTITGPTSGTMTLEAIQNLSGGQTLRFNLVINLGERVLLSLQPGAKRMASDWRGILPGQPLPTSDFANFKLQPTRADGAATNTIVTFVTGTTTGALFLMHWVVAHWGVDGPAA